MICSACLACLQKLLMGKSDGYRPYNKICYLPVIIVCKLACLRNPFWTDNHYPCGHFSRTGTVG